MEQGCPHRSILPHIFPDCNSFAIKIGGKFCGVRGACPGGGLPRRCRCGGRQRYPAGGVPALSPAYPATVVPAGGLPALPPVNPAFNLLPCPHPPSPLPGGKGVTIGYFLQGAAPLASPGLNPRSTGSPCHCGKLNGGACLLCRLPALPLWCPRGACPLCRLPTLPLRCPRGACPLCRLLTLPLAYFFASIPPTPFPAGRGRFFVFLCKGLRPLHPRG